MNPKYVIGDVLSFDDGFEDIHLEVTDIKLFPPRIGYELKVVKGNFGGFPTVNYFEKELEKFNVKKVNNAIAKN